MRPYNVGEIGSPSGIGESGEATCGDVARFTVRISKAYVEDARYKVYGCAASIAAGSALSKMVRGRSLIEAAKVSKLDIENALGGPLPVGKEHALVLVLDALHKAFEDYWNKEAGARLVEGYRGYEVSGE
ncbi:MAG: iron-sulfur cluster assembly scaffold protein [Rubrobacter sp.]|nr:iron-sulfur cluster assembly scaffold protein [Rubrobacter sp.]